MIQSVRKTLEIMEYIAQNGNNVRLLDIANALHLQTTTTHNFLKTLNELGYVEQTATSPRYRLTSKVHTLLAPETSLSGLKKG